MSNIILALDAGAVRESVTTFGAILRDCVEGGASVSFMDGLSTADAESVVMAIADRVETGRSLLLAGATGDRLYGLIEVVVASPPNQPHRAELSKLMVHRAARWRGLGRALVLAAEDEARRRGKTLLTLDTTVGSLAERLFSGMGYMRVGVVPGYALHPNGIPSDAVFFWKTI